MLIDFEIGLDLYKVEYDFKVTAPAIPQTRDEPGCGPEYEVSLVGMTDYEGKSLTIPDWLAGSITDWLIRSDEVYDAVAEAIDDEPPPGPDPDERYDRKREDPVFYDFDN